MADGFDDDEIEDDEFGEVDAEYNHDDQTNDMFGSSAPALPEKEKFVGETIIPNSPYLVLARKYRPQVFEDLVGQEAMVKTLTNAFKQNRIAHAFMLTGVRGIGKTTTARLIARALNYSSPGHDAPSMDLSIRGLHCDAITQGRHPDVLELDAASRSGVDNMRELLDNVRYGPTQSRHKVYIIDEVHMLSTAAFNALLKTLEEPPPHTKFIFATTETHKVPVTILSRCQRFDLRRLSREALTNHLGNICTKENVSIEREGLELIAIAADGSVRDALSLLDQAIVQETGGDVIKANQIRDMLGLSDKNRTHALFAHILAANTKAAIDELHEQYDFGATPLNIIQSLMELSHEVSKFHYLGDEYRKIQSGDGFTKISEMAKATSPLQLSRIWQMLLQGLDEIKRAPDALQAIDMCIIRIAAAQNMPGPEELMRIIKDGAPSGDTSATDQKKNNVNNDATAAARPEIKIETVEDMCFYIEENLGDKALSSDIERYLRPVQLKDGLFTFEPTPGAPRDFHLRISAALQKITFKRWRVYLEDNGGATIAEKNEAAYNQQLAKTKQMPQISSILTAFPGAKIKLVNFNPAEKRSNEK
ncbi:DNA polymerase III subunit gamma/tau [Pseudaquidulcibacter saccharophilus]|uniref:DNA polymerase III subunit gamma/tau n=1 Tax=Pseudaquidulcibacter saccharophilus TaxID=2831900 RepID=UPI001EFF49B7|nr:DNA polymerase III subunit gamma/tau [Pseudaquidulcibacter saccharophilus]